MNSEGAGAEKLLGEGGAGDTGQAPRSGAVPESQAEDDGHLRYLLTAYVFDNISALGREEVEIHLAACAECRQELEELRSTAQLLEGALTGPRQEEAPYSFEAHRLERVLAAAEKHSRRSRRVMRWVAYGAALAA
ncbi:anti-sigma factor family protein, partial [Planctomycetota bacterium]